MLAPEGLVGFQKPTIASMGGAKPPVWEVDEKLLNFPHIATGEAPVIGAKAI